MKYRNPILSGFHPDPSICRAGEDFYLVTSTFEFYPGVPVYHSRNLVDWELLGYCMTEENEFNLEKSAPSGGIYAPTIRYHEGMFFMITTNVSDKGHFIVYTEDIKKGWSKPQWISGGGIDPTLFWDDDGSVYFVSNGNDEEGRSTIEICEINPFDGKLLSERRILSYGCGGKYPEGAHLYKRFGKYYLMLAEGGTEYGHMETIQRADHIYGPYEPCPHNPILTHRDDTKGEIHCTGHADLVEDQNGNWWMVCLGTRCNGGETGIMMQHHLGRETFLTPVVWNEEGWPIVGDNSKIALSMEGPLPREVSGGDYIEKLNFEDDFSKAEFDLRYNYLRNPHAECYIREPENKSLLLKGTGETLNDQASPTWIGVRQQEFCCDAKVDIEACETREGFRAGLTAFYNQYYHYEICVAKNQDKWEIQLAKHVHDIFAVTAKAEIPAGKQISLRVEADKGKYYFYYTVNGEKEVFLGSGLTAGLSTEGTVPMSFTGTYLALFAENGDARFKNFSIKYKK